MLFDDELLSRFRQAERLIFFTGAGASTESGIPTFRNSENSFWVDFDTSTFATEFGFWADPTRVWQWYRERRQQLQTLAPNPAHRVMAAWQDKAPYVSVITQNIDGFHQLAGSRNVIELHGNIANNKCIAFGHQIHGVGIDVLTPPRCPQCDTLVRPDIVWFDEELKIEDYQRAEQLSFNSDVFVSIGCSMEIYPAAQLPVNASQSGAYLIQINPMETPLDSYVNCNLRGKAGEILPLLWEAVWLESLS